LAKRIAVYLMGVSFALVVAQGASAQTISIAQGNGQLICVGCVGVNGYPFSTFDDVVVLVSDANGNPLPNATVTWTVRAADGLAPPAGSLLNGGSTTTGSTAGGPLCNLPGYSCNRYTGSDTGGNLLRVLAVTATYSGKSVTFTLTEVPPPNSNGSPNSINDFAITSPPSGTQYRGTAGSIAATPIQFMINTFSGTPVANVSVRLVPAPQTPAGSPTATCVSQAGADPGTVLTNAQGIATCNVLFGSTPSPNPNAYVQFQVLVGGVVNPQYSLNVNGTGAIGYALLNNLYELTVLPATPNALQLVSGNFQSANPSQAYAAPLVVKVVDGSTPPNPLINTPVTWSVSPVGSASVLPVNTSTDNTGQASTVVTLGPNAVGSITVTATTSNGKSASFTLGVNSQLTGLTKAGGDGQTAAEGQIFAQALQVQAVAPAGQSTANQAVTFTVTSGSASITSTNPAITNAQGLAGANVIAGNTPGPVVVTATLGALPSVTFNLTVSPPSLNLSYTNFLNGAGFFPDTSVGGTPTYGALSPCSIGTLVVGTPLNTATLPSAPNLFPAPLQYSAGASITFNPATTKEAAPILNVTGLNTPQTLITFQVPCDTTLNGNVPVSVTVNGTSTPAGSAPLVAVREASLGIFEIPMSDGNRRALLVRPDGSIVSLENPARAGEMVRMYVTGIGPTSPLLATASLPLPGVDTLSSAYYKAIAIGSQYNIPVVSERASPDFIGAYELTFAIPANAQANNNTVLEVGIIVNTGESMTYAQPLGSKIPIQ